MLQEPRPTSNYKLVLPTQTCRVYASIVWAPKLTVMRQGLDRGRRICVFGFCRSIEMLNDVVQDTVLDLGGEVHITSLSLILLIIVHSL